MSVPALGHYLPQTYLKGFTDTQPAPGRKPSLWVATPRDPLWKLWGVKGTAAMRDYYVLRDRSGGRDETIEKVLADAERRFKQAMEDAVLPRLPLGARTRGTIAEFAALMMVRLPIQHERIKRSSTDAVRLVMQGMRSVHGRTEESWKRYLRKMERETGESFEGLTPDHFDPERFQPIVSREYTLAVAFAKVLERAEPIGRMAWRFYYSTPPDSFITSDQPFALHSPLLEGRPFDRPGLLWPKDVEATLPLSRSVALHGTHRDGALGWHEATTEEVKAINLRTATYARGLYIASNPVFPGHEDVTRKIEAQAADRV